MLKRKRFFRLILLVLILFLAAHLWAGYFVEFKVKPLAAKQLSGLLKQDVSIGGLNIRPASLLNPCSINVVLDQLKAGALLKVERVVLRYRVTDLFFRRQRFPCRIILSSPVFQVSESGLSGLSLLPGETAEQNEAVLSKLKGGSGKRELKVVFTDGRVTRQGLPPFLEHLKGTLILTGGEEILSSIQGYFFQKPLILNYARRGSRGKFYLECGRTNDLFFTLRSDITLEEDKTIFKGIEGNLEVPFFSSRFGGEGFIREDGGIEAVFKPRNGEVNLKGKYEKGNLDLLLSLKHLLLLDHDLVGDINIRHSVSPSGSFDEGPAEPLIKGRISICAAIVDYKPFKDMELLYNVNFEKPSLLIDAFVKKGYRLSGDIGLAFPYPVDLLFKVDAADMADLNLFVESRRKRDMGGKFSGSIKINGPIDAPNLKGALRARKGSIENFVEYETINVSIDGRYPVVFFNNSEIISKDGYRYTLEGRLDFSRVNILKEAKLVSEEGKIVWGGWMVAKGKEESRLELKKELGDGLSVGIKTPVGEEETEDKNEVEIEYKVKKRESIKVKLKEDEEFIGVEHKEKF